MSLLVRLQLESWQWLQIQWPLSCLAACSWPPVPAMSSSCCSCTPCCPSTLASAEWQRTKEELSTHWSSRAAAAVSRKGFVWQSHRSSGERGLTTASQSSSNMVQCTPGQAWRVEYYNIKTYWVSVQLVENVYLKHILLNIFIKGNLLFSSVEHVKLIHAPLVINRSCVAGAVLQIPLSLTDCLWEYLHSTVYSKPYKLGSWNVERMFTMCHMSGIRCQVSGVRYQVSSVNCQVSGAWCPVSGVFFSPDKVVELVCGGSVIRHTQSSLSIMHHVLAR